MNREMDTGFVRINEKFTTNSNGDKDTQESMSS